MELTDKIEELKDLLTNASDMVARGELRIADSLLQHVGSELHKISYDVWLGYHRSGEVK